MAEYRFGTPIHDRLCLFDRPPGIQSGYLSMDGLRLPGNWKNGVGENDFHGGDDDVLELSYL